MIKFVGCELENENEQNLLNNLERLTKHNDGFAFISFMTKITLDLVREAEK